MRYKIVRSGRRDASPTSDFYVFAIDGKTTKSVCFDNRRKDSKSPLLCQTKGLHNTKNQRTIYKFACRGGNALLGCCVNFASQNFTSRLPSRTILYRIIVNQKSVRSWTGVPDGLNRTGCAGIRLSPHPPHRANPQSSASSLRGTPQWSPFSVGEGLK